VAYPANVSIYKRGTIDDEAVRAGVPMPLPALHTPAMGPAGFHLFLSGVGGHRYLLETSEDLLNWTSWGSAVAADGVTEILDPDAAARPARFYRCMLP
jgi:hypothetical protein